MPRPPTGRQVSAGAESAAQERAQHQASLRGDLGLSDPRLVRPGRTPPPPSSGRTIMLALGGLVLIVIAVFAGAVWQAHLRATTISDRISARHHRVHHAIVLNDKMTVVAPAEIETAPLDASAEWEAAHPAPPEDDVGNE